MKKITEIYKEYEIIPVLQAHQLRVAAMADKICESIKIPVDRNLIVTAAIFHDMGNVVKFNLEQSKSVFGISDEELIALKKNQDDFIKKYSDNEYEANTNIARELGLPEKVVKLISGMRFENLCIDRDREDWHAKILHYADSRVAPTGILSYDERLSEAGERYKDGALSTTETKRLELVACGKEIEKQIFAECDIKPEDINNESIKPYVEKLKDFEI